LSVIYRKFNLDVVKVIGEVLDYCG